MTADPAPARSVRPSRRPLLVLPTVAGIAALVTVGFVLAAQRTVGEVDAIDQAGETVVIRGCVDPFDAVDAVAVPITATEGCGLGWAADGERWVVSGGHASPSGPAAGRTFATVDIGSGDGAVQVWAAKASEGAGLVFRYRDPANHWSVVAIPAYATWAVVKTVNGQETIVGNTGLSPLDGAAVGVRLRGDTIDVVLGSQVAKTIVDGTLMGATAVGMTAQGLSAAGSRFDDFTTRLSRR